MSKSFADRPRAFAAPLVPNATAFTVTSTAAVQIQSGRNGKGVIYMTPTQNAYIKFGDASVGAATSSDFPLLANTPVRLVFSSDTAYFRVIRASADGTLSWYVEGQTS